ncbi:MAG: hypothetical protein KIS81_00600 [Maricaulaceae bacterium]|nr:hypothetical protein [Maricaulaceae bacterium]
MMALGRISDVNHAMAATLSGGEWSAALPLSNLKAAGYVSRPARQLAPGDLSKARFDAALDRPRRIDLVAILFHSLSLDAQVRVSAIAAGGDLGDPDWSSGWRPAYGRWFDSDAIDWDEPNWWTGLPLAGDLGLWPRHFMLPLALDFPAAAFRVEFDDAAHPDGYFDLGGLWLAGSFTPRFNFERGRDLELEARDMADEAPGGREFFELRPPRRAISVSWPALSDAEARRLYDAGGRARRAGAVLFVPDAGSDVSMLREAWPATFETPPAPQFTYDGANAVSATLREIIG